jgi:hypothetical protein
VAPVRRRAEGDRSRGRGHRPLRGGRRDAGRISIACVAGRIVLFGATLYAGELGGREASGAHRYGRYLEEFEVGAVSKHWPAKTVTEGATTCSAC